MPDSLGEYLQQAREAKGLTLEEVASRTRILPQYLKAVEENNYTRLPDEVFAKGFVRSYARLLGMDEDAVIRKFNESGGQFYAKRAERETLKLKQQEEERRKKVNRNIVTSMVGAALVILFVLMGRDREAPEPMPAREAVVPVRVEPPAPPAADAPLPSVPGPVEVERNFSGTLPLEGVVPEAPQLVLDLEAVERCWVLVKADHAPVQEVMLHPGERVRWRAQERFTLTLGNAGGVRVSFNGNPQGPYGTSGQVVKGIVFTR
jgi:transcriptional regulator with XRE-family HTH domain